jgi:hypothetical protein
MGRGALGRPELEESLDLEPARAEEPDHLAVRDLELGGVRPVEPIHAELIAHQAVLDRDHVLAVG